MILIDSHIPMYLVGAPHPHKTDAQRWVEKLVRESQRLVTDAEVLQEILHRYGAIGRRDAIQPAFDALLGVVDEVLPVTAAAVQRARQIVLEYQHLSARCRAPGHHAAAWHREHPELRCGLRRIP